MLLVVICGQPAVLGCSHIWHSPHSTRGLQASTLQASSLYQASTLYQVLSLQASTLPGLLTSSLTPGLFYAPTLGIQLQNSPYIIFKLAYIMVRHLADMSNRKNKVMHTCTPIYWKLNSGRYQKLRALSEPPIIHYMPPLEHTGYGRVLTKTVDQRTITPENQSQCWQANPKVTNYE